MKDISKLICLWISCCNDLWRTWFLNRINGAYDFSEIENVLFRVLVMRSLGQDAFTVTLQDFLGRMRVQYKSDFHENRQVCVTQRSGNVFCKTEIISLKKGTNYRIRNIDTVGTMMNSAPYVDVIVGKKFVLESPDNLFLLSESFFKVQCRLPN